MKKENNDKKQPKIKFCYNKLWKLLIDKGIMKKTLREQTQISGSTLAKLNRGENVNTHILLLICEFLQCDINDIMEIVKI
ncbi:MAG: helix-turn-helix transcriptional regulator [Christensenellaceae bacterium]|jgi:DNA-binding Xre family transcriptional regulator|nr:helix-turn-helix transcriptional regulator [Christensenellaceae bacterium]